MGLTGCVQALSFQQVCSTEGWMWRVRVAINRLYHTHTHTHTFSPLLLHFSFTAETLKSSSHDMLRTHTCAHTFRGCIEGERGRVREGGRGRESERGGERERG